MIRMFKTFPLPPPLLTPHSFPHPAPHPFQHGAVMWMSACRKFNMAGQTTTNAVESYHNILKHCYLDEKER